MDSKLMESILFGDDLNTEKLRLRRAIYLRFIESILLSSRPRFCLQKNKQNYIGKISKQMNKNNAKSGPCLEISCETFFQPRIPAHLIWCILHTACTLFLGTDLKYNPPPYLRELTIYLYIYICIYTHWI